MTTTSAKNSMNTTCCSNDPLALLDVDHVRFWVGNAKQAAYFYAQAFGFQVSQISDLTTGSRETAQYLLTQGNIRFLLETPLEKDHPATNELSLYGDGIKDIALTVSCAKKAYERAVANGAIKASDPTTISDKHGSVTTASIQTYGRAVHTFVSRTGK